jgi:hypothetical protein
LSHKTEIKTELTNKDYLLQALTKMGFTYKEAQPGETLTTQGMYKVNEEVDILITGTSDNKNVGRYRADVGFKLEENGTYTAIGDFYHMKDVNGKKVSESSLKYNTTAYAKEIEVNERLSQLMFRLDESSYVDTDEEISLTLERWV